MLSSMKLMLVAMALAMVTLSAQAATPVDEASVERELGKKNKKNKKHKRNKKHKKHKKNKKRKKNKKNKKRPTPSPTAAPTGLLAVNYFDVLDTDYALLGYASIPEDVRGTDGLVPAVVILPDWDNINQYELDRAQQISDELGYVAFAADLYGADMHDVQEFDDKLSNATFYRSHVEVFNGRIQSAIDTVKSSVPNVDPDRIGLIGYCLGGSGVLTYSFFDSSDIVGAVSFHGGLMEFENNGDMKAPVLVLSGGDDDAGTAVEDLEARLKGANADWQITRYSGIQHGFTKPSDHRYNAWADRRSWREMVTFFAEAFGETVYGTTYPVLGGAGSDYCANDSCDSISTDAPLAQLWNTTYNDNGFELQGYTAQPWEMPEGKVPGVVVLPDWDGVNGVDGYEAGRAVQLAIQAGYVALAADIYGTGNTTVVEDPGAGNAKKIELTTYYRTDNVDIFVSRMQAAVDKLLEHPQVDPDNIFVLGYCFGGSGAIDYAFSPSALSNVRAVVPFHGGLNPMRVVQVDNVLPYVLVQSGGEDDAHGNPTELELQLDGANADWEITRYSNTHHGFTKWGAGAYNARADQRSWDAMMSLFQDLTPAVFIEE